MFRPVRESLQIWKGLLWYGLLGVVFFLLLNTYLIIPMLLGKSALSGYINIINVSDINSFKTVNDSVHGVLWNTAAMYGFWAEIGGRYAPLKTMVSYWFQLYLGILALSVWGVIASVIQWARVRRTTKASTDDHSIGRAPWVVFSFVIIGFISFVLAVGIAHPWTAPVSWWMYNHVPFYKGLRDSQKWVGLLVVCYAYLGALGVDDLIPRLRRLCGLVVVRIGGRRLLPGKVHQMVGYISTMGVKAIPALFLVIPLLYAPGMFGGFKGQICVGNYPKSWLSANEYLKKDPDTFRVLFLPWHQYINLSFACHKIIANPAALFFDKPTIAGDNLEMGAMYTQSVRPESKYIEGEILEKKEHFAVRSFAFDATRNFQDQVTGFPRTSFGTALLPLNIKYVILAQESDFFSYGFVGQSPDMKLVYDSPEMKVYLNERWQTAP